MGADYVFRLNSCYDPDLTGTGRQPYAWDQVSPLYQQYIVDRCTLEITFFDPSEDGLAAVAMLAPAQNVVALSGVNYEVAAERPMSVGRLVANTGSQKTTIRQTVDMAALEGVSKMQYMTNQGQYGAACTSSPALFPQLRLSVGSVRSNAGGTISFEVRLTFRTQLFERIIQSTS